MNGEEPKFVRWATIAEELDALEARGWDDLPAGQAFAWRIDSDWRPLTDQEAEGRRCRLLKNRRGCGARPVAEMRRGRAGWWAYCADHLFGRHIEAGAVVALHVVALSDAARCLPGGAP